MGQPFPADPELTAFTRDRLRAAASFVASLFLTAWERAGDLQLPVWDERSAGDAPWAPKADGEAPASQPAPKP